MLNTDLDFVEIGSVPVNEACAQIGPKRDNAALNLLECRAYIAALKRVYGDPPTGAEFRIKANHHEFGTYREVRLMYDTQCVIAQAYANRVENGLGHWREARMSAPVHYDPRGSLETEPLFTAKSVEDCFWPDVAGVNDAA
jgi:hypothetical protein